MVLYQSPSYDVNIKVWENLGVIHQQSKHQTTVYDIIYIVSVSLILKSKG